MKSFLFSIVLLLSLLSNFSATAQRIVYSEIEKEDNRQMNFEILGKIGGNISIYKNNRSQNQIAVYDNSMALITKTNLSFLPEKLISTDFVVYADNFWMFYQFQKKNVVYYNAVKINGDGKLLMDPIELDTTHLPSFTDNKIYSLVNSEDKQQIIVFKINRKMEKRYVFTLLRCNPELKVVEKNVLPIDVSDREAEFTDFVVNNDGDFIFGKFARTLGKDYVNKLEIVAKKAVSDSFSRLPIPLTDKTLDEVKLKPDNVNKTIIINSFFYKQRRGNIDGIFNLVLDKSTWKAKATNSFIFGDTLRMDVKPDNASIKSAFNDFFIKQVVPKRGGGFVVMAEMFYTSSRNAGWNRSDYLFGYGYMNPFNYGYYSPYNSIGYNRWGDPYNRWGTINTSSTRYFSENVVILSFDTDAKLEWSNVIHKSQFDDNSEMFLSYQLFNTGSEIKFLYNELNKRELLLSASTLNALGKVKKDQTLKNLDRNFEFMPRYGKQIGARQIVLPCLNKNYVSFAKLDF